MAKKVRRKINWYGNNGRCNSAPGTVKTAKCGVCGRQMDVKHNVFSATDFTELRAGGKHRHDSFVCPNIEKEWHRRVVQLKIGAIFSKSDKVKKALEEEIIEILEANAVR